METPTLVGLCRLHVGIVAWSLGDLAGVDAVFSELLESPTHSEDLLLARMRAHGVGDGRLHKGRVWPGQGLLDAALSLAPTSSTTPGSKDRCY